MDKGKIKKIVLASGIALSTVFIGMTLIAKKKKKDYTYESEPAQKNPMEGKKVVFVEDENDIENADGMKGHLAVVGVSEEKTSFMINTQNV